MRLGTSLLVLVLCVQIMMAAFGYAINVMVDNLVEKVDEQMALFPTGQSAMRYNGTVHNYSLLFPSFSP